MPPTDSLPATAESIDEVIESGAIEQARWRLDQLQASFSSTLLILADMHQDEDWRYLTDSTGTPYSSFTAMLSTELEISESWARRQQQGVVDLVLPLRKITHPDTRIPVSSRDVAILGKRGAEYVCEHAERTLTGVLEPRQQEKALRQLLDDTRSRIAGDSTPDAPHVPAETDETSEQPSSSTPPPIAPRTIDGDVEWIDDDEEAADEAPAAATSAPAEEEGPDAERARVAVPSSANANRSGGSGRYGAARTAAAPEETGGAAAHRAQDDSSPAQEALTVQAEVSDGSDPYTAAIRVVAAAVPGEQVDVDLEVVTAAMLKLSGLRSRLMAQNKPAK